MDMYDGGSNGWGRPRDAHRCSACGLLITQLRVCCAWQQRKIDERQAKNEHLHKVKFELSHVLKLLIGLGHDAHMVADGDSYKIEVRSKQKIS